MPTQPLDTSSLPAWAQVIIAALIALGGSAITYGGLSSDVAHLKSDVAEIKSDVKIMMMKGR